MTLLARLWRWLRYRHSYLDRPLSERLVTIHVREITNIRRLG
jgi:hypothetical protein